MNLRRLHHRVTSPFERRGTQFSSVLAQPIFWPRFYALTVLFDSEMNHLHALMRCSSPSASGRMVGKQEVIPIPSCLPVVREQSGTIWRVVANHFGKTDLSVKQKLSGRASPFWTGTPESRKTVASMLTRKDDQ